MLFRVSSISILLNEFNDVILFLEMEVAPGFMGEMLFGKDCRRSPGSYEVDRLPGLVRFKFGIDALSDMML